MGRYVMSGVEVQVDQQAVRPREPPRPSPHTAVNSPEMGARMIRPRGSSPVQPALASKAVGQVMALKGQQAALEKLLAQMIAELKKVTDCAMNAPDSITRSSCMSRKVVLEKAIAVCMDQIKLCASKANVSAIDAIKNGASQKEVVAAAAAVEPTTGQTSVIESATMQVTPSGQILPGFDATVVSTPVVSDPNNTVAANVVPGANPNVNAAVAASSGLPWGKLVLAGLGLYAASRFLKKRAA